MTTTLAPAVGAAGPLFQQGGVGNNPGYSAIDVRRFASAGQTERALSSDTYVVSQHAAGAAMSVDIAANVGDGLIVQGDAITQQGRYLIPPHNAVITEAIGTADATNPRIDSVIVEVKDDTHDASGSNLMRTRVVAGTPTAGATKDNATGAAALPPSAMLLAYLQVDALATSIPTAKIRDMRPRTSDKSIIATSESRTNTAYGTLTTPDQATVTLLTDGLIKVLFQATWQESVAGAASVAIFLGSNQVAIAASNAPTGQQATQGGTAVDVALSSSPTGLVSGGAGTGYSGDLTTGQIVGASSGGSGGAFYIFAVAGTYTVSVQFKASSGSVTAKNRKLWATVEAY